MLADSVLLRKPALRLYLTVTGKFRQTDNQTKTILNKMNIWRIHLKADSQAGIDQRQLCLDKGIVGVGWQIDYETVPVTTILPLFKQVQCCS